MKITANMAITLDGFIAREDGSVDYLDKYNENITETDYFPKFLENKDLVIMGHTAYLLMLSWGFPWENKKVIVFTNDNTLEKLEGVEFFSGDVNDLKKEFDSKNAFLFGGANITRQFIESGLVDEFEWAEIPEKIGRGIILFNRHDLVEKYGFNLISERTLGTKTNCITLFNYVK